MPNLAVSSGSLKIVVHLLNLAFADIAELIDNLNIEEATYLIKLLESDTTADALAEIDDEKIEKIL